ncbi:HAMP domain-containing sensor histidine kinase [Pedobacter sp. Leaf250]|uniref:sensor histidine kinase n=1 Tax=Pedobacter sp. Leaf250 TaxID=2876559 RepID=UPI001E516F9F|nr:HAMP domain-containing sensor histidine kinase [Pedobacter sp. Leaf250]
MKLAQRYNRANLITSFIILAITGVIYYIAIHFILTSNLDKDLVIEEREIEAYVKNYGILPAPGDFLHQKVTYKKLTSSQTVERNFSYDHFYNEDEKKNEPGRSLTTMVSLKGAGYQVTISKSRVESEDLVQLIFAITLAVTVLLLISLLLINRFLLQRIWSPFYSTLGMMKAFNITQKDEIKPNNTTIDEFNELNESAHAMAIRVRKDYHELKNFTDNASHEMMTPLAIINSKLDSLLQTDTFSVAQGAIIEDIYTAIGRLIKLNQSLLLLSKIENKLISDIQTIDFQELIKEKMIQFQELFEKNELILKQQLEPCKVNMSKYLADILLNNLFANAIRHNIYRGSISIILNSNMLLVENTGKTDQLNYKLFERFSKSAGSEGTGLGLAISKQICNLYGFEISYHYFENAHQFKVKF